MCKSLCFSGTKKIIADVKKNTPGYFSYLSSCGRYVNVNQVGVWDTLEFDHKNKVRIFVPSIGERNFEEIKYISNVLKSDTKFKNLRVSSTVWDYLINWNIKFSDSLKNSIRKIEITSPEYFYRFQIVLDYFKTHLSQIDSFSISTRIPKFSYISTIISLLSGTKVEDYSVKSLNVSIQTLPPKRQIFRFENWQFSLNFSDSKFVQKYNCSSLEISIQDDKYPLLSSKYHFSSFCSLSITGISIHEESDDSDLDGISTTEVGSSSVNAIDVDSENAEITSTGSNQYNKLGMPLGLTVDEAPISLVLTSYADPDNFPPILKSISFDFIPETTKIKEILNKLKTMKYLEKVEMKVKDGFELQEVLNELQETIWLREIDLTIDERLGKCDKEFIRKWRRKREFTILRIREKNRWGLRRIEVRV